MHYTVKIMDDFCWAKCVLLHWFVVISKFSKLYWRTIIMQHWMYLLFIFSVNTNLMLLAV